MSERQAGDKYEWEQLSQALREQQQAEQDAGPRVIAPRNCYVCKQPIPLERLEALPETQVCVLHSTEPKLIGYEVYSGKTAPTLALVDPRAREALRRAQRANRRAR